MWHVSVASTTGLLDQGSLRRHAYEQLDGYGNALYGQWEEWSNKAFHLRRQLTAAEAQRVGPVLDIRGTIEARDRLIEVAAAVPSFARHFVLAELES